MFTVPSEASEAANNRYESFTLHTPWERAVGSLSNNRYLERNAPLRVVGRGSGGEEVTHLLQDFQVWQQGGVNRC